MRSFLMPYGTVGRIKRSGNHCETWAVRPDVPRNSRHPTGGYPRGSRPQTARFPANRVHLNFPQIRRDLKLTSKLIGGEAGDRKELRMPSGKQVKAARTTGSLRYLWLPEI